jgi:hypothetical protein
MGTRQHAAARWFTYEGGDMRCNTGGPDRFIRITLGVFLLALVFIGPKTPWGYLGVLPLLTGVAGYCPLYAILGISTEYKEPKGRRPIGFASAPDSYPVTKMQ